MKIIRKYIGMYRVLAPIDNRTNKITANLDDTYLIGRSKIECYRIDSKTLAIYLPKGRSTANTILSDLEELGVDYKLHIEGDYELVYTFPEEQLPLVHRIIKFQVKGKNIDPNSIKNVRKLEK